MRPGVDAGSMSRRSCWPSVRRGDPVTSGDGNITRPCWMHAAPRVPRTRAARSTRSEGTDSVTRIDTLLAHAGGDPEDRHGAVNPPVYRFSTILSPPLAAFQASRNPAVRFDQVLYGQLGTPTTFALEEAIAAIEGGYRAMLLPSGLAAVTAALQALLSS